MTSRRQSSAQALRAHRMQDVRCTLAARSPANLLLREGIIMRVMSLALPVSLVLLASSAVAQTMPYPMPDTAPVTTVQITAPAVPVRLREEEVR